MSNLEKKPQKKTKIEIEKTNLVGKIGTSLIILLSLQCRSHFQGMQFTRHLMGGHSNISTCQLPQDRVWGHAPYVGPAMSSVSCDYSVVFRNA